MNADMPVEGSVDPAFRACFDAFRSNFEKGGELGAACAIYRNGQPILDVWGGIALADIEQPWQRDTAVPVFSVTKGVAALCVLAQADQGKIDLDAPLARYWPEFGEHGKDRVTVREALAHRAGVPAFTGPVTIEELADPTAMSARLANEPPAFEPGSAHLYHAITVGWITTELVRRATGQQVGAWFRDHIANPMGLNIQIGRQPSDSSPLAQFVVPPEYDMPPLDTESWMARALSLNNLMVPSFGGLAAAMNDPRFQRVEMAGANGLADARSLARFYSAVLTGSEDVPLPSLACVKGACTPVSQGAQWMTEMPSPTWGAGLVLPWAGQPMLGEGSFGHDGMGGSLAFAHAPSGISFAYVRNRSQPFGAADPYVYRVVQALADTTGIQIPYLSGH